MSSLTSPQGNSWLAQHPKLGISLMDHLFNRLDGMYPNKWRASFGSEQAIENWRQAWAEAFIEEGITPAAVQNGLRAARVKFPWPPSLPEFLTACRPDFDPEKAWHEAVRQMALRVSGKKDSWSHPAIYWAAVKFSWELRTMSYPQIKARWESELEFQRKQPDWPEIPEPMVALPEKIETVDPAKVAEARAKIREMLMEFADRATSGKKSDGESTT